METDEPQRHLIQLLSLEAGRIMEDESPALALRLPGDHADIEERVARLTGSAGALLALAIAAEAILKSPAFHH